MSLFAELKRRNVFRVGTAYVVISWLALQVADVVFPIIEVDDWVPRLVLWIIAIGFVPTLLFAWAFELTPDGVRRERDVDRSISITHKTGQKLNRVIIAVLVLIILLMAAERMGYMGLGNSTVTTAITADSAGQEATESESVILSAIDQSIAALPFSNHSSGLENTQFFSDGIHDDLLTKLAKIDTLRVISRTSVMNYRDTDKSMRQIGRELGVRNLLEGGVQQAGNRVRINAQLINAENDEHIWAETYDREISTENIFEIQGEIARAIANALQAELTPEQNASLGKAPTHNIDAYRTLLLARQYERRGNFRALEKAAEYARQSIGLDPVYVDAHLSLAYISTRQIVSGSLTNQEAGDQVMASLDKAMGLEPENGLAWSILGYYKFISGTADWEADFEKAMSLDPDNSEILFNFGFALQRSGQPEPALPLLLKANLKDPLSQMILFALGRVYGALGEHDKARKAYTRIREIDPSSTLGYATMSGSYLMEGALDQALYWNSRAVFVDPQDFELGGWMVSLNDSLEDYAAAQAWSEWLDDWITKQPQPMAMQARHHYLTGNFQLAVQIANRAFKMGLADRWSSDAIFMRIKRDEALANGTPMTGVEIFRSRHPEILHSPAQITAENVQQAVDLAQLLEMTGQSGQAQDILKAVIRFCDQPWATGGVTRSWLVPVKAEALALMGDETAALAELRRIIDQGWRIFWRWETELNSNFNGIRESSEFQAMLLELQQDMEKQRAITQAMITRGEILPPPALKRKRGRG